jgi:hypothetical protein
VQAKDRFYKYSLKLKWPAQCRNRTAEILQQRPDLVDQMNKFRVKITNVCGIICRDKVQIDTAFSVTGVRLWFSSGQDCYDFIIRQPEFEWELWPELDIMNVITSQLENFDIVYSPTGVSIV